MNYDYIPFLIASLIITYGISHGLYSGVGLPLWAVIPIALVILAVVVPYIVQKIRGEGDDAGEEATA